MAIEFQDVSKRYRLGMGRNSLRAAVSRLPGRILDRARPTDRGEDIWALRGVSFTVPRGSSFGVVGPNGAGKTTILKLLAGVTTATGGQVEVRGRVAALIELGAGFHPELSGRENVYLNGIILGMKKREIQQRFEEIVAFAELERFIDTPVKRYSSGMYVRLGFAVAVHCRPDVLLVDEVLAVGDAAFQAKCYGKMAEFRKAGVTIVLVSHNLYAIRDNCDQALLLRSGRAESLGASPEVIAAYTNSLSLASRDLVESKAPEVVSCTEAGSAQPRARISDVVLLDGAGRARNTFHPGETMRVRIDYDTEGIVADPIFGVDIYRGDEFITGYYTSYSGCSPAQIEGQGSAVLVFPALYLPTGTYSQNIVISQRYEYNLLSMRSRAHPFSVLTDGQMRGNLNLPHEWVFVRRSAHGPEHGQEAARLPHE